MKRPSGAMQAVYWIMVIGFILLMSFMIILPKVPAINEALGEKYFPHTWFSLAGIFVLGGIGVIVVTVKEKSAGWLKACLLTSGIVSILFLITVLSHNWLWILGKEGLSMALYNVAMFVCPAIFIIGAIPAGLLLYKKRQ